MEKIQRARLIAVGLATLAVAAASFYVFHKSNLFGKGTGKGSSSSNESKEEKRTGCCKKEGDGDGGCCNDENRDREKQCNNEQTTTTGVNGASGSTSLHQKKMMKMDKVREQRMGDGGCCKDDVEDAMVMDEEMKLAMMGGAGEVDLYRDTRVIILDSLEQEGEEYRQPEEYRIWLKTFGCSHNSADSETMAGVLKAAGFINMVNSYDDADVVVLNSCTVKNPSQESAVNLAVKAQKSGKRVVVTGCVIQADRTIPQLKNISCVGVQQLDKVAEAVTETINGNVYQALSTKGDLPSLDLPKIRHNDLVEVIALSQGCLGACTYCKTRFARGVLRSYPLEQIVHRVRTAAEDGVQQIWLSSEDAGAYGIDLGISVIDLLQGVDDCLEQFEIETGRHIKVRFGMTNPPYILRHLQDLGLIFNRPNSHMFKFLHVPVQSGSNKVLDEMNREYTVEDFHQCMDQIKSAVENIHFSTDFICGFPNEEETDHEMSMKLLDKYKFDTLNISQFYPRPGTPAFKMKRVPTQIVKKRSTAMTKLFMSYETHQHFVDTTQRVWVSTVSDKSNHVVGHTGSYVKVLLPYDLSLIGKVVHAKIHKAVKWHIEGTVLDTVQ